MGHILGHVRPIGAKGLIMSRDTYPLGNKLMAKVFNLPCVSTWQKMVSGKLGVKKKALKGSGNISTDVIVIFDEIYLQKCEEYFDVDEYSKECFLLFLYAWRVILISSLTVSLEREVNGYFVLNNLKECLQLFIKQISTFTASSVTTTLVMCLRTGNCFYSMEMIHLIFISHSIVSEYICSSTAFIWWRAFATISSNTKDSCFHLMILKSLMTAFVFLLAK